MPDREKVIKGLEDIVDFFEVMSVIETRCNELKQEAEDAIALLKEQEKAKVVFGRCKDGSFATECSYCGMYLDKAYSICPKCKKELDWNSHQD